jgi:O-antigen/teichoic acid export membrane protein
MSTQQGIFRTERILRGVTLNWVSLAAGIAIAFFLSPFVVHHLGNEAYGVWLLVVAAGSYMGLLDLGLRAAVMRFIARGFSQKDHDASSNALSAALHLRVRIAAIVMLCACGLSAIFPHIVHIASALTKAARIAIILAGMNVAIVLLVGVVAAVLPALQRFDLASSIDMGKAVFRAIGVLLLLSRGFGIVALAVLDLACGIVGSVLVILAVRRVYPQLKIRFAKPGGSEMSQIWQYSLWIFVLQIMAQFIYYSDNFVVGIFASAAAVTFYAIGGSLVQYVQQVVSCVSTAVTPIASDFEAHEEHERIRKLVLIGSRVILLVALPIQLSLLFRGSTFIGLWMGPQYAHTSGRVLQILLCAQIIAIGNASGGAVVYGIGRHKPVALWAIAEAIANLTLSILLVRKIGINGVAIGTLIPNLCIQLVAWPWYLSKILGIRVSEYFRQIWLRVGIAAIPFAAVAYLSDERWHPTHLITFFAQIAAILPVFGITAAMLFRSELVHLWARYSAKRKPQLTPISA